jgi:hypothetical protein
MGSQELCGALYTQVKQPKPDNSNGENHLTAYVDAPYKSSFVPYNRGSTGGD